MDSAKPMEADDNEPPRRRRLRGSRALGLLGVLPLSFAGIALLAPLADVDVSERIGLLLVISAALEIAHGYRRTTDEGQRAAWYSGGINLAMGIVLINAPFLATTALLLFLGGSLALDGVRSLTKAWIQLRKRESFTLALLGGIGNLGGVLVLAVLQQRAAEWAVAVAGAIRMFGTASNLRHWPVFSSMDSGSTVLRDLGLPDNEEIHDLADRIAEEESARESIDRGWIAGFIVTLFAIHIGRMGFDRTVLGIVSPGVAVLGDVAFALLIAFAVVIPCRLLWQRATRPLEVRAWSWCFAITTAHHGWIRRCLLAALRRRIRSKIRLRQARYSFRAALSRGLQIGLPLAAVVAATVPIWGMSWYFDTENWAAGIWNSWAEQRTDAWREAMVRAAWRGQNDKAPAGAFAVHPPEVHSGDDFSFLVIGDTGEGDASQHSLRATWLEVVRRPEVKFVVISSDVVYPTGAMRNYETNFWLPFMGTAKPVYAIPGNHDWYDALEAFVATFYTPDAARVALRARVEVDNGITATTDRRIEELIATASRYRQEYGVPTQYQQAPFFQFQTDRFALFAIDTGVLKRVDRLQFQWLERALEAARGKLKMAILGHPFIAGGHELIDGNADFAKLHELLQKHQVSILMAGDTHDLEYYQRGHANDRDAAHYIVNGGGGAYLSFGTALDWPSDPPTPDWAFYPSRDDVMAKIDATTPIWKWPAWAWTRRFGAWPFSAEWLSAAFDSNVAPFYQSFIEVRVEPSKARVRLMPYGVHGRLRWQDMEYSPSAIPPGERKDSYVEWTVPFPGSENQ